VGLDGQAERVRRNVLALRALLLAAAAVLALPLAAAPELSLERADAPPPSQVAAGIRGTLGPGALRVQAQGKPLLTFWLRKEIPAAEAPRQDPGVTYHRLKEGGLVGVVEIPEPWTNYRGRKVKPGVYTMRYGIQPSDGNHTGLTEYRDYVILVPASQDQDPSASYTTAQLVELQKKATGYDHPGVLALFPVASSVTDPVLIRNDLDQPTLAVKVGDTTLGLVVLGQAPAEGY
jgi:hypothetical protein